MRALCGGVGEGRCRGWREWVVINSLSGNRPMEMAPDIVSIPVFSARNHSILHALAQMSRQKFDHQRGCFIACGQLSLGARCHPTGIDHRDHNALQISPHAQTCGTLESPGPSLPNGTSSHALTTPTSAEVQPLLHPCSNPYLDWSHASPQPPAHTLPSSLSTVQLLLSLSEPILDQATECKVGCQEDALQTARRFTTRIPVVRIDP